MAVSKRALMRSEAALKSARSRLAKLRNRYEAPNYMTIGAQAVGGALPVYLIEGMDYVPNDIGGVPTEALVGGALIFASTQMKNNKAIIEGLGSGMIAVASYKLAQQYTAGE
jgi:hypothetical protein